MLFRSILSSLVARLQGFPLHAENTRLQYVQVKVATTMF
jgi:hypothetical protein